MDQLIAKYLQGNLTLEEQHELSKWIQSDEKNAETLRKLEIYWKDHQSDLMVEELEVRRRLLQRMQDDKVSNTKSTINYRYLLRIAAILVFVFSISLIVVQVNFNDPVKPTSVALVEKVSLPGQKISTLLPDGTIVKLNTDSKIITPAQFSENSREVTLIGEAFFDVKRDESRPFTIKTASMEVTVLGTSFSVSAYEDSFDTQNNFYRWKMSLVIISIDGNPSIIQKDTFNYVVGDLNRLIDDVQFKVVENYENPDINIYFGNKETWSSKISGCDKTESRVNSAFEYLLDSNQITNGYICLPNEIEYQSILDATESVAQSCAIYDIRVEMSFLVTGSSI